MKAWCETSYRECTSPTLMGLSIVKSAIKHKKNLSVFVLIHHTYSALTVCIISNIAFEPLPVFIYYITTTEDGMQFESNAPNGWTS